MPAEVSDGVTRFEIFSLVILPSSTSVDAGNIMRAWR